MSRFSHNVKANFNFRKIIFQAMKQLLKLFHLSQLSCDAIYGHGSGKTDEDGETVRGQDPVFGLSNIEGTEG